MSNLRSNWHTSKKKREVQQEADNLRSEELRKALQQMRLLQEGKAPVRNPAPTVFGDHFGAQFGPLRRPMMNLAFRARKIGLQAQTNLKPHQTSTANNRAATKAANLPRLFCHCQQKTAISSTPNLGQNHCIVWVHRHGGLPNKAKPAYSTRLRETSGGCLQTTARTLATWPCWLEKGDFWLQA